MQKLLLVSILAIAIVPPALAARHPHPGIALRKALLWTFLGVSTYVLCVLFLYPRL